MRAWTYPFRRFGRWLHDPSVACAYRWCARPQVGFSAWCREHTDRIMAGESTQNWPRQATHSGSRDGAT